LSGALQVNEQSVVEEFNRIKDDTAATVAAKPSTLQEPINPTSSSW